METPRMDLPPEPRRGIAKSRKASAGRRLLALVGGLLLLAVVLSFALSAYIGWTLTHPARKPLEDSPDRHGLRYENVTFVSEDGVTLKGWWIPARANGHPQREEAGAKSIIFAHGYRENRVYQKLPALELAKMFLRHGYDVFLFDFRNSGESGGKVTSVGQWEKLDLLAAVREVRKRNPNGKIGLIGFSMGAVTAVLAAAESKDVSAVVADSPFANLREYLSENLSVWSGLPDFPFTPMIMTIIPPLTGIDPDAVDPRAAVAKLSPRPLLLIHGDADRSIPYQDSQQLFEAYKGADVSLWLVPGAGHVESFAKYPQEYAKRVLAFFAGM
ncbi:alpha/beta hydrolase [Bacillaceae bacterium]